MNIPLTSFSHNPGIGNFIELVSLLHESVIFSDKVLDTDHDTTLDPDRIKKLWSIALQMQLLQGCIFSRRLMYVPVVIRMVEEIKRIFASQKSLQDCEVAVTDVAERVYNQIGELFDIHVVQNKFAIPEEALDRLGIDSHRYSYKMRIEHDCYDFAFWEQHEPNAILSILGDCLDGIDNTPPFSSFDCPVVVETLLEWGYEIVGEAPAPHDLIAYVDDRDRVNHFGIMETHDRVVSKWGTLPVFSHPVNIVSHGYGNRYVIFRKSRGNGLEKSMLAYTADVAKNISTFELPACYSPLSSKGSLEVMKQDLTAITVEKTKIALPRPPYGKRYFREIQDQIRHYTPAEDMSRLETVLSVQSLLKRTFTETDPMII